MSHSNYKIIYCSHGRYQHFTSLTIHLHTSIHILALDVTSLVFKVFPASGADTSCVHTKLQYSLTDTVVVIVCYIVAKIHSVRDSELAHLCRVCSSPLAHHSAGLLTTSLLMLGLTQMQESHC